MSDYVQICVTCCKINKENRKSLPFMCPKTQMPCFAVNPDELSSPQRIDAVIKKLDASGRISMNDASIDQSFVTSRIEAFDKLKEQGNKTIYAIDAF